MRPCQQAEVENDAARIVHHEVFITMRATSHCGSLPRGDRLLQSFGYFADILAEVDPTCRIVAVFRPTEIVPPLERLKPWILRGYDDGHLLLRWWTVFCETLIKRILLPLAEIGKDLAYPGMDNCVQLSNRARIEP
jgi:hypothetical protein